jgi:ribosomal protein L21E
MSKIKVGDKVTFVANPRRFHSAAKDRKMLHPGSTGTVRSVTGALAVVEFFMGNYAADFVVDLDDLTLEVFTPVDAAARKARLWDKVRDYFHG